MSSSDDDDPVIQEIDVYLARTLSQQLHLIQYPVRPTGLGYENVPLLAAKFKPQQEKMELELGINTHSPHYCKGKGEQIAINVDGAGEVDKPFFTGNKMDKQILSSLVGVKNPNTYAVGMFKDRELHITPLKCILQMRPSFAYLDKSDTRNKVDTGGGDHHGDASQDEEEPEPQAVKVRFTRETEEAKQRRLASYEHKAKLEQEEAWLPCQHYQPFESKAEMERQLLFSKMAGEASQFQMSQQDYLTKLIPRFAAQEQERVAMPTNVISLADLKLLPLSDQIRALLVNAKLMRFSQLMALLPKDTDPTAVLRSVQQVAVLVQGCWVIKSEVLYPKDSSSPHSGVSAEVLCRARDFVLWKYTHVDSLSRKEISSVIKVPSEDLKDILEQVSQHRINQGWLFALEQDRDFLARYPEVVQRQHMLWQVKCQQLMTKGLSLPQDKKDTATKLPEKPKRRRTMSRSRHKSGERSMSDQSDTEHDLSKSSTLTVKQEQNHKVPNCANGPESNAMDNMPNHTDNSHFTTELLKFVREKLMARYILTLSELKRLLSLQLTSWSPGHILSTGVTDQLLEQAVINSGAIRLSNQWPPDMKEEQLFAFAQYGDPLDQVRASVLSSFAGQSKIRSSLVKKVVEQDGISVEDTDLKKVLKDYCVTKGGVYFLKFTLPYEGNS